MKVLILILFLGIKLNAWSQKKDTLIGNIQYSYNYKRNFFCTSKVKKIGNYTDKKKKDGIWISFEKDGSIKSIGNYKGDVKIGRWWYNEIEFYDYSNDGKVEKKGRGCLRCPQI